MANSGFPLPNSSYKELIKIIQGYGKIATEATLSDVAKLTAVGETIVSANNKFLMAIGVIQGGKKKTITPLGADLANALQHDIVEEIAAKWRAIVEGTDFLQKVVGAVRIRKGMDESSLESHIAYSAGQPKTPAVTTGARAVVDILLETGLVREEGGSLIASSAELPTILETVQQKSNSILNATQTLETTIGPSRLADLRASATLGGVHLSIEVRVQCAPDDLEGLGRKLRRVIHEFNNPQTAESNDDTEG